MADAIELVRQRVLRASRALERARLPFTVIGGNAVGAWVARVDLEAVRNTKDVDLLVRRADLPEIIAAMSQVGFAYQNVGGLDLFLDGEGGSVRSAVHLAFERERIHPDHPLESPGVEENEPGPDFPIATLDALVRMKLNAFRLKDKLHLQDLLGVGLIDAKWCDRLPAPLGERLREVIELE
ncbi:MAG: hypothetical protein NT069_34215 [Planctomycetota bacterium]|nr:hypothetical protein [Planctomycetota bacterium]